MGCPVTSSIHLYHIHMRAFCDTVLGFTSFAILTLYSPFGSSEHKNSNDLSMFTTPFTFTSLASMFKWEIIYSQLRIFTSLRITLGLPLLRRITLTGILLLRLTIRRLRSGRISISLWWLIGRRIPRRTWSISRILPWLIYGY